MNSLLKSKSLMNSEAEIKNSINIWEDPVFEDTPEIKKKLSNCSQLISEFLKTLDINQVKCFFDIEMKLSDYYSSREELLIKNKAI